VFLLCFPFGRKQEHIKSCSGQILLSYERIYWCYVANRKPILNLEIGTEIFNRSGENRELNYESQSHFLLTLTYSGLPIFNEFDIFMRREQLFSSSAVRAGFGVNNSPGPRTSLRFVLKVVEFVGVQS